MRAAVIVLLLAIFRSAMATEASLSSLDWAQIEVERPGQEMPHGVLAVSYRIPNVVCDNEVYAFSFVRAGANVSYPFGGGGKSRDGLDQWCSGSGRIERAGKEGIRYVLDLSWGTRSSSKAKGENFRGKYSRTILIPWQSEFTYRDDTVVIEARIAWLIPPAMDNLVDRTPGNSTR